MKEEGMSRRRFLTGAAAVGAAAVAAPAILASCSGKDKLTPLKKEGEYYVGRTEFDSPEVDPEVLIPISDGTLRRGSFYTVEITDADDFDLYAKRI